MPTVDVVQGDNIRTLAIALMSGDEPWPVPLGAAVVIRYCCIDGTGGIGRNGCVHRRGELRYGEINTGCHRSARW